MGNMPPNGYLNSQIKLKASIAYVDEAVGNIFSISANRWDGSYVNNRVTGGTTVAGFTFLSSTGVSTVVFKAIPGTTYTISKSDDTDRFGIGTSIGYPIVGVALNRALCDNTSPLNEFTLTLQGLEDYIIVYLASAASGGLPPANFQIEEGSVATAFVPYKNNVASIVNNIPENSISVSSLITSELDAYSLTVTNIFNNYKMLKKNPIHSTVFSGVSLPADWVQAGSVWTVNNGLISPATGGWNTYAVYDKITTLDRATARAVIKIVSVTSKFAIIRRYGARSTVAEIDCQNKTLQLYASWDGTTTVPAVVVTGSISFNFVANREYLVTLEKDQGKSTISITDMVTRDTSSIFQDNAGVSSGYFAGRAQGTPGLMFHNGSIIVKKFEFIGNSPKDCKCVIMGDSITEGFGFELISSYDDRYCARIRDALKGNANISGRGGDKSADLILRLPTDLHKYTPEYVVITIGTNDATLNIYSTWVTNIGTIISEILSAGAIPVFCTPPLNVDSATNTRVIAMAAYLRTLGYTVVGFDYVTSINNDGITFDATKFMVDGIHPSPEAHELMYNQFRIDAPFIFE